MEKTTLLNALIAGVLVIAIILLFGCIQKTPTEPDKENAWLSIIPVQCGGNAWEKWYSDQNRENQLPAERSMISEWLQTIYGVKLLDYKSMRVYEVVCEACSCPRGDKVFIQLSKEDAGKLNWVREEPPKEPVQGILQDSCIKDDDCTKTVLGCCPCSSGGKEQAVNKQWLAQQAQPLCEGIMCAEVFMCTEREAKCLQEKCELSNILR